MKGYRVEAPYFGEGAFAEFVERARTAPGGPSEYERAVFGALQGLSHIYAGTVDPAIVEQRRRRNRRVRWQRAGNQSALRRDARAHRRRRVFRRGQAPFLPGISQPVDAEVVTE